MSYEVMCICGQILRGERQRRHQVVSCPNCDRKVFVLPFSPLDGREDPPPAQAARSWWRSWKVPLMVGAGSVLLLLAIFVLLLPSLLRKPPDGEQPSADATALVARIEDSKKLLAQRKFNLALRGFNEAINERDRQPHLLGARQNQLLNQLQRQAALLTSLSLNSLEDIAWRAMLERDSQERALQMEKFSGRGFIFDGVVRRDPKDVNGRRLKLGGYVVLVEKRTVRLALEDLTILQELPLDERPRLIFGARFSGCEPETGGDEKRTGWVIHFRPDSGVLFTDVDAVEAASPGPLGPGLKETLQQQQEWLDDRGGTLPSKP